MHAIELAIAQVPLHITAHSRDLLGLFADYFRYYSPQWVSPAPETAGAELRLDLKVRDRLAREELFPPEAELVSRTGVVRLLRAGEGENERFYFDLDRVAFRVDAGAGRATGLIQRDFLAYPHILTNTFALFALLLLLRRRGRYHLHAAAVLSPRDEVWLICGAPRSGKTTLATALGLAGWRPISDDSLLVGETAGRPWLTALKKEFHLGDALFAHWPALAALARNRRNLDRTCVAGLEFFGAESLADRRFERIDHLVLPRIAPEPVSRLESLSRGETLLRYAEQSTFLQLWPEHTARQWRALTTLTRDAACHRFVSGRDLLDDPASALRAFSQTVFRT